MDIDGVQIEAHPKLNNHGYFSIYDYEPDDKNYNIVVIGGEQTASSTVTVSWPDHLQDLLGDGYKVYNVGWPDAGPRHYIDYWNNVKNIYQPDLVIINFVGTDFLRGQVNKAPMHTFKGQRLTKGICHEIEFPSGKARLVLDGVERADHKFRPKQGCSRGQLVNSSLTDPFLLPSRPYGFFVDKDLLSNDAELKLLKHKVVSEMVEGAINYYGCMMCMKFNNKLETVHNLRNFDPVESHPLAKEEELLKFGRETFGWMATNIPSVIFIRSFSYPQLLDKTDAKIAKKLSESLDHFQFYDARNYMPAGNAASWFYTPWMGEKLSAEGMKAYAKAVFDILQGHLDSKN